MTTATSNSTAAVAEELVALCRAGRNMDAIEAFYSPDIVFDVTFKPSGKRERMEEVALYTVDNGKIVREHFFYNPAST